MRALITSFLLGLVIYTCGQVLADTYMGGWTAMIVFHIVHGLLTVKKESQNG